MLPNNTDKHWEYWGKTNPYWGVLTSDEYRKENITEEALRKFFDSGQTHIESVLETIHTHFDPKFQPSRALDFGCGVGRLLIPLSSICTSVVGIDVSPSMLQEAKRNCESRNISNVELILGDDSLRKVLGTFDFIHSFLVFQHIPIKRGILRRLIDLLQENGIGALHFMYHKKVSRAIRLRIWAYKTIPILFGLRNLLKGESFSNPLMQMNEYNLNNIFQILQESGCSNCYVQFIDCRTNYGIFLFFQKIRKHVRANQ